MAKTVAEKLGHKPGMRVLVVDAPEGVDLGLPDEPAPAKGPIDLLIAFVRDAAAMPGALAKLLPRYADGGRMWFAYPKKSGKIATDIDRDRGWEPLAAVDLLPVTQIAIDETWSALRFRRRHEIPKLTRKGASTGPSASRPKK